MYIATTRFNHFTWEQNKVWREINDWNGCIYGSPTRIKEVIPVGVYIIILEMHNDNNTIMGIGLISNNVEKCSTRGLYDWGNYNRFVYKGKYRIDRDACSIEELKVIGILETLVFKGSRHLKRGHGVTILPEWISKNKHICFETRIRDMFKSRVKQSINNG